MIYVTIKLGNFYVPLASTNFSAASARIAINVQCQCNTTKHCDFKETLWPAYQFLALVFVIAFSICLCKYQILAQLWP